MNGPRRDHGYDRLAGCYQLVETLAFGRALTRARFQHFERLSKCRRILLLGDGDGRGLAKVCRIAPYAHIDTIDASAGMLQRAERRLSSDDRKRVNFIHGDARSLPVSSPLAEYDAVTTLFFLDVFTNDDVRALIARIRPALAPGALWLHADFELPPHGWKRLRARAWLTAMLAFFRWQTDHQPRALPDSHAWLQAAGLRIEETVVTQCGFLRSTVYRLPAKPGFDHLVST